MRARECAWNRERHRDSVAPGSSRVFAFAAPGHLANTLTTQRTTSWPRMLRQQSSDVRLQ
jgi:hypothetical protein